MPEKARPRAELPRVWERKLGGGAILGREKAASQDLDQRESRGFNETRSETVKGFASKPDAAVGRAAGSGGQGVAGRKRTGRCRKSRCASWRRSKRICCLRSQVEWRGRGPVGWAQRRPPAERRGRAQYLKSSRGRPHPDPPHRLNSESLSAQRASSQNPHPCSAPNRATPGRARGPEEAQSTPSKWPRAPESNPPGVKRSTGEGAGRAGGTLVHAARPPAPGRTVGAALGPRRGPGVCRRLPPPACRRLRGRGPEAPGGDPWRARGCAAVLRLTAGLWPRAPGARSISIHAAGARVGKAVRSPSQSRAGLESGAVEALGGTRTRPACPSLRRSGREGLGGFLAGAVSSASREWKSRWVHGRLGKAQDDFVGTARLT